MDTKRKANGAATPDTDDRAAKRRKVAESYDLSKGESPESTTAYGLNLVDQVRRTADKTGRRVAGYFDTLPPREGNDEYYRVTKMPIALDIVEEKLQDGEFHNLSDLESYLKRMVSNAKDWFHKDSSAHGDAERVRKAISNYMTKHNPAYQDRNYQAVATPLPKGANDVGEDEDGEDQEDEDGQDGSGPRKRSIILKRRAPGRSARNSLATPTTPQETPRKATSTKPDHQYEDVPYKGLTFQEAQEKIVEEMVRHNNPDYEGPYFEAFVNLPPRSLKDYYKMISDPLSLKKLQKLVKGVQGRGETTGVSEYKSWGHFEGKAKLLWENAYFFNEDTSEIYGVAQELEKFFYQEFKQAKAQVTEPVQPKIKLKLGQQAEPPSSARRVTIHVGNGRGTPAESPAPAQAAASPAPSQPLNGAAPHTQLSLAPLDKARSASIASPSPSIQPVLKGEEARMSPAVRPPSALPGPPPVPAMAKPQFPVAQAQAFQPIPTAPLEQKRWRGAGKGVKDALISNMRLQFSKGMAHEPQTTTVFPDKKEMQTSATINLPHEFQRVAILAALPEALHERHYSLWVMIDRQPIKLSNQPISDQGPNERLFETHLRPGMNVLEAHLCAALPREERQPNAPEVELEVFTIFVNVARN